MGKVLKFDPSKRRKKLENFSNKFSNKPDDKLPPSSGGAAVLPLKPIYTSAIGTSNTMKEIGQSFKLAA